MTGSATLAPAPTPIVDPTSPASPAPAPSVALVIWLEELTRQSVDVAGGKGANLGELLRAGLPVPDGFVITVHAYRRARAPLDEVIARARTLDPEDTAALQALSDDARRIIDETKIPDDVRLAITEAYHQLVTKDDREPAVAVRSSATAEDTAQHSFAGMFESYLDIRGADAVLERVRACWASAFGARVLYYRLTRRLPVDLPLAVVVQRMVLADKAGIVFTADPVTQDRGVLVVEASWGFGEAVVGGRVTPDRYVIDKKTSRIIRKTIARKDFLIVRDPRTGVAQQVPFGDDPRAGSECLDPSELAAVIQLSLRTEAHFGLPVDIEFAVNEGRVFLTQTRPITTLGAAPMAQGNGEGSVLVRGVGASPGRATGMVRVLSSPAEAMTLGDGEILVTRSTSPDWAPIMRRAGGIVTDLGGITSHAAIVSRELGIPCIVGTIGGTKVLTNGTLVTVDGSEGTIVGGRVTVPRAAARASSQIAAANAGGPMTATRLYVNLADPSFAPEIAARDVDGVGLLRAEFMMLSALEGTHPRRLIEKGRGDEFVDRMTQGLAQFAGAFDPRPVVYRAMDFRTNEVRGLAGGDVEPVEANPMIGFRGCFRYGKEPDLFRLELRALTAVRRTHRNLHLMIPFVRTLADFTPCKRIVDELLGGERGMELWIMAEVPSVIHWLPEFARLGVTGVSIGSNDLTQLMLGVDRDSELVAPLFDERDGAVLAAIRSIIRRSRRLGLTTSICGQAPSTYPEYVEQLVRWGIDSVSVNPDVIETTRRSIAAAEQGVLLETARGRRGR